MNSIWVVAGFVIALVVMFVVFESLARWTNVFTDSRPESEGQDYADDHWL